MLIRVTSTRKCILYCKNSDIGLKVLYWFLNIDNLWAWRQPGGSLNGLKSIILVFKYFTGYKSNAYTARIFKYLTSNYSSNAFTGI